jgi:hypothetical protein
MTLGAPAGWCRAALLGTGGQEPVDADPERRRVSFELTRLGRRVRGIKIVDVGPLRMHAWLVSGRLPWFEDIVELEPVGEEETEIVWSVRLDPGETVLGRAHIRLARRWLARDARSRLESIRMAAVARAGLLRATSAERVPLSA